MKLMLCGVQLDEAWDAMEEYLRNLMTCNLSSTTSEEWHNVHWNIFQVHMHNAYSFERAMNEKMTKFLEDHVDKLYARVESSENHNLLHVYHRLWQEYTNGSSILNKLFSGLERYIKNIVNHTGLRFRTADQYVEIKVLALNKWRQRMLEPLKQRLVELLLQEIHTDRMGGTVNASIIHSVIHDLVDVEEYKTCQMSFYSDAFETLYLKKISEYYMSEALKLKDLDRSQYMTKVISRLNNEDMRSRKFLHPNSYEKVRKECHQRLIGDHLQFLYGECKDMIKQKRTQELKHIYKVLSLTPKGLDTLITEVELHIKQAAQGAVMLLTNDNTIATKFVEAILEVHSKYMSLIKEAFNADHQFIEALDRACQAAINMKISPKAVCKAPEWLAKYCNTLLKKSTKGLLETERANGLSQSLVIFKYLHDKDLFERFYSQMLAKRLIKDLSQSMDAEETMISRLQHACGFEFTNKLHGTSETSTSENSTSENTKETITTFALNMNYSNKHTKFKVTVQKAETQEEVKHTHAQVEEDRKTCLQATIVRIMKYRKRLSHNMLIQEVIGHLSSRFLPDVLMIKKCIEKLIEKEYMKHMEGCKNVYLYIA